MRNVMFLVLFAGFWSFLLLPGMGYEHTSATEADGTGTRISWVDMSETEGTTITVTTYTDELTVNGDCSLREAIQAANTDIAVDSCPAGLGVDTILLSSGVYTLALTGRSEDNNATGDLDIRSSLVISGAGVTSTTLDANQIDRALHVFTGTVVSVQGLLIRNGLPADGSPSGCGDDGNGGCDGEPGGGIHNSGRLTITDTIITRNRSGDGGGVDSWPGGAGGDGGGILNRGVVSLYNSTILNNRAGDGGWYDGDGGNGGGIANADAELILVQSFVTNNLVGGVGYPSYPYGPRGSGGYGGGIYNTGVLSITGSRVAHNGTVVWGKGGGLFSSGEGLVQESDFYSNGSDGSGGAIANQGGLLVMRSVVNENRTHNGWTSRGAGFSAASGGGIHNIGDLRVANSTISNNRTGDGGDGQYSVGSGGDGAGIYNTGSLRVENTTFAHNRAGAMGDILPDLYSTLSLSGNRPAAAHSSRDGRGGAIANEGGQASLRNSILADNHTTGSGVDCWGTLTSAGYNLIQNSVDCTLQGDNTGNILDRYAWLEPLADNGGTTATHALRPQSPALNTGSCIDSNGRPIVVDQRGEARPQGVACDIGAFESGLTYTPPLMVHLPLIGNWEE